MAHLTQVPPGTGSFRRLQEAGSCEHSVDGSVGHAEDVGVQAAEEGDVQEAGEDDRHHSGTNAANYGL